MADNFNEQQNKDNEYTNFNNYSQGNTTPPNSNPYEPNQAQNQDQNPYYNAQNYSQTQQNQANQYQTGYSANNQYSYNDYQPVVPQKPPAQGAVITGFVLSLVNLVCCCAFSPLPIVSLILSIVAMSKGNKKGLNIATLVLSIVGIVLLLGTIIFFATNQQFIEEFTNAYEYGYNYGYNYYG